MKWIILLAALMFAFTLQAETLNVSNTQSASVRTAYIANTQSVSMRTAPNTDAPFTTSLTNGDAVAVINRLRNSDFVLVRNIDGQQGWVNKNFLVAKLDAVDPSVKDKAVLEAKSLYSKAADKLTSMTQALDKKSQSWFGQADQIKLEKLTKQNLVLNDENKRLHSRHERNLIITGAMILLFGSLLGFLLGRVTRRRRSSQW